MASYGVNTNTTAVRQQRAKDRGNEPAEHLYTHTGVITRTNIYTFTFAPETHLSEGQSLKVVKLCVFLVGTRMLTVSRTEGQQLVPFFFLILTLSAIRILQFYRLICSHTRYKFPVQLGWPGAHPATLPSSIHVTRPLAKLSQVFYCCALVAAAPLAGWCGLRFCVGGDASFLG
jgi:hypothetical protein